MGEHLQKETCLMEKPYISRKEQAQLTKKKIFDTTMRLVRKKGYSKITIREICQNARISVGTFYLYFSSKDDILLEIYHKADQKITFPAIPSDTGSIDYPSLICGYFSVYLRCMTETQEKELLCEIYRSALVSGNNQFLNPERPLYRAVLSALGTAAENGALCPLHTPPQVCQRLFLFVQSYIYQWLTSNELTSAVLTETCILELALYLTLFLPEHPHPQK